MAVSLRERAVLRVRMKVSPSWPFSSTARAKDLFAKSETAAQARFAHLEKLVELYK